MMDKPAAVKIIRETFENSFEKEQFVHFARNLLNKIDETKAFHAHGYVAESFKDYVKTYERIGTYTDPENNKIDVLIVYLQRVSSLEHARTAQRNFVARYLKDRGEKEAGLIAFISPNPDDWRFSLVKMDYTLTETPGGKVKVKEEFTPARRYSFLVGENESSHTAQSQLVDILADDKNNPPLSTLEGAFNIEVATKEFFRRYRELFHKVTEELDELVSSDKIIGRQFDGKEIDTVNFAKKLLGQIVFLYFLQKKGWLGVHANVNWGGGDKKFLRNLFEKCIQEKRNFFNDYLEYLFYDALNNRDRGGIDPSYYQRFDCRIPFLNGGLFDSDYDWIKTDIIIPNAVFSDRKTTNDEGSGILDIFDLYNFTVKEDEPLDKEVAVDPEMLGKVFENLLEVKDRKSKGTYYTPREIVHYMCQESLINYLDTALNTGDVALVTEKPTNLKLFGAPAFQQQALKTPGNTNRVPREDIEAFVRTGELAIEHDIRVESHGKETGRYSYILRESIRQNARLIDEKLANIRVCDPAVGSGAFPVGLMTEIIRARNTLTTYLPDKGERTKYHFKRHAIQNCLYGVDIDPGAVEIAKLRLWLSLVVDEEDIKQIQPLPNLDYKIVCGNSLLSVPRDMFNNELFKRLEELKPLHFDEANAKKKQSYKSEIDSLISKITDGNKNFDFEVYFSEVFHKKGGFDVVIANPPYLGEKGHKELFRKVKQGPLGEFYQGKMDVFYFFFHLAINLGRGDSQVAFITTNYYPTAAGAKKLRQDLKRRTIIKKLVNFNELKIFESALGQHNMVTILSKGHKQNSIAETCITRKTGLASSKILQDILNWDDEGTAYYEVLQEGLFEGDECYIRLIGSSAIKEDPVQKILNKMIRHGELLGNMCNVNNGIFTGADSLNESKKKKYKINIANVGDGIFVLTKEEVENLNLIMEEEEIIKPFFKSSKIHKYFTENKNDLFIINLRYTDRPDINNYPKIKRHLSKYKTLLADRPRTGTLESAFNNGYWYVMSTSRKVNMESQKIIAPQRSPTNTFGYNEVPWYASADVYFITEKHSHVKLKYILALLNARLYYLWLYIKGKRKGEALELYQIPLSEVPIKIVSSVEQKPFIDLVDQIIVMTKDEGYFSNPTKRARVKEMERQIDQMVYELYGLTPEEIEIVEGSGK